MREWARVYTQLARREPNTTGRRFPVSALRLRWLSVTQTRIIALIVKSARGVSERTALCWEGKKQQGGEEEEEEDEEEEKTPETDGSAVIQKLGGKLQRPGQPPGGAREARKY